MKKYADLSGDAGVVAYEERPTGIALRFADGSAYLYTHDIPGREHVVAMKQLARKGRGLTTYVNQHVRGAYAKKLV